MQTEIDKLVEWQKTKDPNLFAELVVSYQPIVNSVVNKYRTVGVSPPTLRAKATAQLINAMKTYDPKHRTIPKTHIWNNLQKVQRIAGESLQSGHIPEYRSIKRATFTTVRDNITDRLGREPNVKEMADELSWSQKEVSRMNNELGAEITQAAITFDSYGDIDPGTLKDKELATYIYHAVGTDNRDKVILEHVFGFGGKKVLKSKEIAKKLRTNEMAIVRARRRLASKIESFR
jgi:DNA-directed RNA polymerase specialized sigma subunit